MSPALGIAEEIHRWSNPGILTVLSFPNLYNPNLLNTRSTVPCNQKSDALPPKLQSPCLVGSVFGPPTSPVTGFLSPANSAVADLLISGCNSLPCSSTFPVGEDSASRCNLSNSSWRCFGNRGGEGRLKSEGGLPSRDDDLMHEVMNVRLVYRGCIRE